jgi:ribosomal protein S18 acetylase RimI-like enzyme
MPEILRCAQDDMEREACLWHIIYLVHGILFIRKYMQAIIRLANRDDEPFLWQMLYYAAHMDEDGESSPDAAKSNPDLRKYVEEWGQESDLGVLALHPQSQQPIGAAWVRLLKGEQKTFSYIDDDIPELAIAVLPEYVGQGIGTQMLRHLLQAAREVYPAIVLSVRVTNPAFHLYQRLGFEIVGTGTNRVGTESYTMVYRFL